MKSYCLIGALAFVFLCLNFSCFAVKMKEKTGDGYG